MTENTQPEAPLDSDAEGQDSIVIPYSGVIYGDIIYWGTLAGALMVIAGSIMTFVTQNNYIPASYLIASIWEGKTVEEVWSIVGGPPNGHWYLEHLTTGNGLTMAGIALGVFSVTPGLFAAAFVLIKEKLPLYAVLAAVGALITIAAMLV